MERQRTIVAVGLGEVLYDHDTQTGALTFGGAPANFADHFLKCAALLGGPGSAEVFVASAVGVDATGVPDERGRGVLAELAARGLGDALGRVAGFETGIVDKRKDAQGVNSYEIRPGAWDAIAWTEQLAALARRCDVVSFGSLAQRSAVSHATVCRFLDEMIATGRPTLRVFDVNIRQEYFSREVLASSIDRCNIIKISDEEAPLVAECLTGYRLSGCPELLCRALLDRHPGLRMVILTEGAEGNRIFLRDRISVYLIPREGRVRPVDTVGAGDSFTAAFCAQIAAGRDIWTAQRFASQVAAFVCSRESATPAYPADAAEAFGAAG